MDTGTSDHPLRLDPLNSLPDAILVPRRPRPRATSTASPSPLINSSRPSSTRIPPLQLGDDSIERREFEKEAVALLEEGTDDPLIREVVARVKEPESPPAGRAFATNVEELFMRSKEAGEEEEMPVAAGLVDRSDVKLTVAEVKRGGGAGVYIVKSKKNWIFVRTSPAGGGSPMGDEHYSVRRSLADFTWLEEVLTSRYEGVIVPPLPSMALAGRLEHGFVYDIEKLRGLERFLRRVATHAVLSTGEEVMAFLGASGEDMWRKVRREPISHENSITSVLFGGVGGEAKNAWERFGLWSEKVLWQAGRRVNKGLVWVLERDSTAVGRRADSAEARLERLQMYVKELGVSLRALRQAAERVSGNRAREVRGVVALQQALHTFGEREGGKFGDSMEGIVLDIALEREDTHSESSRYIGGAVVDRMLEEVFRDYEERAKGAQRIMNARREEQDAYEHALSVYTKLRDKLESRTGSMWETVPSGNTLPNSGEGLEELVNDVSTASARLGEVRRHYQSVALSTTDELRRLRSEMHEDLCRVLQAMAEEFSIQHVAHAKAWKKLGDILADCRDPPRNRN